MNNLASFSELNLIKLKDLNWLAKQRVAGQCVAQCLNRCKILIEGFASKLSLKDLEQECIQIIKSMNCTPTFLGYKGFPGAICASVNTQLVHGIPSNYELQNGDIVKIDLGATYQGAIADAAITAIYGVAKSEEHKLLIETCREALDQAIKAVVVGERLGIIGSTIHHLVKKTRYGLITTYGGHGLDEDYPHAPPFVANKSSKFVGVRFQPGMTLAIEPMLVIGSTDSWVSQDGWTVNTSGVGAHFEHTIYIDLDRVHTLTKLETNEQC